MGSFSWLFADTNNTKNLRADRKGYVAELGNKFSPYRTEIRSIGIDIACYDEDNASLPYPIKITSKKTGICYEELPPSKWDPEQGLCEYRPQRYQ